MKLSIASQETVLVSKQVYIDLLAKIKRKTFESYKKYDQWNIYLEQINLLFYRQCFDITF